VVILGRLVRTRRLPAMRPRVGFRSPMRQDPLRSLNTRRCIHLETTREAIAQAVVETWSDRQRKAAEILANWPQLAGRFKVLVPPAVAPLAQRAR